MTEMVPAETQPGCAGSSAILIFETTSCPSGPSNEADACAAIALCPRGVLRSHRSISVVNTKTRCSPNLHLESNPFNKSRLNRSARSPSVACAITPMADCEKEGTPMAGCCAAMRRPAPLCDQVTESP